MKKTLTFISHLILPMLVFGIPFFIMHKAKQSSLEKPTWETIKQLKTGMNKQQVENIMRNHVIKLSTGIDEEARGYKFFTKSYTDAILTVIYKNDTAAAMYIRFEDNSIDTIYNNN